MTTYHDTVGVTSMADARLSSGWTVIRTEADRLRTRGEVCPSPATATATARPRIGSLMKVGVTTAFLAFVDATNQPVLGSNRPAPPG